MEQNILVEYNYVFGELMKARNPEQMLKNFREAGRVYITEYMIEVIDRNISNELSTYLLLREKNPGVDREALGDSDVKDKVNRMKYIKSLILPAQKEPELKPVPVIIIKSEIIPELVDRLKDYFPGQEKDLEKALRGEKIEQKLEFQHEQNKLVELFRRLHYNNFIQNNKTQITEWLIEYFAYRHKKGGENLIKELNKESVYSTLTKGKGEPPKGKRMFTPDWLPYKTPSQLKED